jgi:hypothetical protein
MSRPSESVPKICPSHPGGFSRFARSWAKGFSVARSGAKMAQRIRKIRIPRPIIVSVLPRMVSQPW